MAIDDFFSTDWESTADVSSGSGGAAAGYGSGLIGGILDAIIGPVMANETFQRQKHVSNRQMNAAMFMAQNQPSWAVQGLINAGLNPILAATKGVAPAQFAPSARVGDANTGSFARALEGGVSNAKTLKLLDNNAKILEQGVIKARNEADASKLLDTKMQGEIAEIGSRIRSLEQGIQTGASQVRLNEASEEATRANARLTGTRDRAERMAIPYSEEQERAVKPVKDMLGMPRRLLEGIIEQGARGGRAVGGSLRDSFRAEGEKYKRVWDEIKEEWK